jgi:hypothetical protein
LSSIFQDDFYLGNFTFLPEDHLFLFSIANKIGFNKIEISLAGCRPGESAGNDIAVFGLGN